MKTYLNGKREHPFLFNLLRLTSDDKIVHVNSIFKNYNDNGQNKKEIENTRQKYIVCKSINEMKKRLEMIILKESQTLYIIAKFKGGYDC